MKITSAGVGPEWGLAATWGGKVWETHHGHSALIATANVCGT